jgi:two-component system, LuxR family, sensor kinase FixL
LAVTASSASAGLVAIAVSDSGTGIPPESLGRIMEPLFSTKARGLGLGLAITRAILEKHGGRLSATSELGNGSTFTLHLPAAPLEAINDKS